MTEERELTLPELRALADPLFDDVAERTILAIEWACLAAGATPEQIAEVRAEYTAEIARLKPHLIAMSVEREPGPDDGVH